MFKNEWNNIFIYWDLGVYLKFVEMQVIVVKFWLKLINPIFNLVQTPWKFMKNYYK